MSGATRHWLAFWDHGKFSLRPAVVWSAEIAEKHRSNGWRIEGPFGLVETTEIGPYEWLTIHPDGSVTIDIADCSLMEMDRRQIIAEEIQAGRLVLAPAAVQR